jgi:hypothetical protein
MQNRILAELGADWTDLREVSKRLAAEHGNPSSWSASFSRAVSTLARRKLIRRKTEYTWREIQSRWARVPSEDELRREQE